MNEEITPSVALRIALAAKSLPNIDVSGLLGLLVQHVSAPLTETELMRISPKAFRLLILSLDGEQTRKDISHAYTILTSTELGDVEPPRVTPSASLDGPKLTVALTSNQGEMVNGHYGSCLRILIYEVNETEFQLIQVSEVNREWQGEERALHLVELIKGCQILFTLSIGGPAAARVTRANVHPIKRPQAVEAKTVMEELQVMLANTPPPWIQKLLGTYVPQHHGEPAYE
ncbi:NifB/NifX family molybdenum-iron cluster-binding protein [Vibrio natriegens]|uniref:NifB/NifX family molybdenum-iron cluster-binding protein n=1 Tax=Vibrio natriegens TaxID=691 RepID=UPI00390984AA